MPEPTDTIPTSLNLRLFFLLAMFQLLILFGLPWLLSFSLWWAALLVPLSLSTLPYWALLHEAVHRVLHPDRTVNDRLGRVMGVLFGSSFRLLQFGHLAHHRFNRTAVDCTDCLGRFDSPVSKTVGYYAQILGGLYLLEVVLPWFFWLPRGLLERIVERRFDAPSPDEARLLQLIRKQLLTPEVRREIRSDALAVAGVYGAAFWVYGTMGWVLLLAVLGRGFLVSFLDNVYHYGTGITKRNYSYNLSLPEPVSALMLHFNYHRIHHRYPRLPWSRLPVRFRDDPQGFDRPYLATALAQLKGPVRVDL